MRFSGAGVKSVGVPEMETQTAMTKGVDMPFLDLFAPVGVGSLQLKNRIIMASISTNFASPERTSFVSERHIAY